MKWKGKESECKRRKEHEGMMEIRITDIKWNKRNMKKRRKQKLIKSRKKEKLEQEENNWKDLDQKNKQTKQN